MGAEKQTGPDQGSNTPGGPFSTSNSLLSRATQGLALS